MKQLRKRYIKNSTRQTFTICWNEMKRIFKDSGVLLILFVAGIAYPLLYGVVYMQEEVYEIPTGIVDLCNSSDSRKFSQKLDATREIELINCINIDEAISKMQSRDIHGIIVIPEDFSYNRTVSHKTTTVSLYINMATMFIYKNIGLAANIVMLDENKELMLREMENKGLTKQEALAVVEPVKNEMVALFNPGAGFASFFVPGVLVLIIHQLLFLGIGMLAGTRREENESGKLLKEESPFKRKVYREIFGRGLAYFILYSIISTYILILIPRIFNLPHYSSTWEIYRFLLPFLLSVIFFSQTWSVFIKNRETGMVLFLFMSVILLFLSGLTWPISNFPTFWKYFSFIFPATPGVQGFVKMNCMGAEIGQILPEYLTLWVQAIFYFITACLSYRYVNK